jgi:hypothetical protein
MVERLYSHKIIVASDINDDSLDRKEDEKFLDTFVSNEFKNTDSGVYFNEVESPFKAAI